MVIEETWTGTHPPAQVHDQHVAPGQVAEHRIVSAEPFFVVSVFFCGDSSVQLCADTPSRRD